MAGFKICHFGGVTGLNQSIEACVDQLGNATAQNCLLAEQIGLGFFLESGLQDTCTACANAGSISQSDVLSLAGVILLYADQAGHALALGVQAAHGVAGALGSDHDHVHILGCHDGLEVDVEAMCKGQSLALGHVRGDLLIIDVGAQLIGNQHHHNVTGLGSFLHFHHLEVGMGLSKLGSLFPVRRTLAQANHNVHAALGQVFRMSMALRAKADHSNGFAVQHAQIAVRIIILFDSHFSLSFSD